MARAASGKSAEATAQTPLLAIPAAAPADDFPSVRQPSVGSSYAFDGRVDYHGYHAGAGGWFLAGWIAHPWPLGHRPDRIAVVFDDGTSAGLTHLLYFHRVDVGGRGIGFVYFLPAPETARRAAVSLRFSVAGTMQALTPPAPVLEDSALANELHGLLAGPQDGSQRAMMQALLVGQRKPGRVGGMVEFYGYHATMEGWLIGGWSELPWRDRAAPSLIMLSFQDGDIGLAEDAIVDDGGGGAVGLLVQRPDVQDGASGVVLFVPGPAAALGSLYSVSFASGTAQVTMYVGPNATRLREADMAGRVRPMLATAAIGPARDRLAGMLSRRPFVGEDTLASLEAEIFIGIDEAVLCGTNGLLLMGWYLVKPGTVAGLRVRSGKRAMRFDPQAGIQIARHDVVKEFNERGFDDPRCGFVVYLDGAVTPDDRLYLEVETAAGEIAYQHIPPLRLGGFAAMKRLLGMVDVRFSDVQPAFDRVVGPAVEALNRHRLATRSDSVTIAYGDPPPAPRFSVVVPLHGRLDFVEYQMALFSAHPQWAEVDVIYVLDDPDRRRQAQYLFASVHERFRVPFRAVLLGDNVGFAPACNIGLAQAQGRFVAFVNSDVFPGTLDWLERLADRLAADPTLGIIGPTLLYEDGSVQHRGMYFERLPEFGGWFFPQHHDKAMRVRNCSRTVERHLAITGACMMMARALAERLGGFDEIFAIGDFEDADLCFRAQALGLGCAVDPDVQLFHLERKSQVGSEQGWRMNLTLYNAWQHQRRWGAAIEAGQAS